MSSESLPVVRVGVCQVQTEPWAVEENFQRVLAALREAAGQGGELLITPECVLHGYADQATPDVQRRLMEIAEPLDSPRLGQVCRLAQQLDVDIVLGFVERGQGQRLHNSAALIGREGRIVLVYRKVHCRRFECIDGAGFFTPGERFDVVTRRFRQGEFPVGVMICFDREVPESVRCLRALGAQLVACPLATDTFDPYEKERVNNEIITRVRATENELCIAVVNHAGRFNGGSFVVGPMGQVVCRLGDAPEVRVVEVPVGEARKLQSNSHGWMGWGYRRGEVYARHL